MPSRLKNFVSLVKTALLSSTAAGGKPIEKWYQDEARVDQKGTHAHVWAPVGSCPLMVKDNRHDSAYLFGTICADRGVGAAIIMPTVNTVGDERASHGDQYPSSENRLGGSHQWLI